MDNNQTIALMWATILEYRIAITICVTLPIIVAIFIGLIRQKQAMKRYLDDGGFDSENCDEPHTSPSNSITDEVFPCYLPGYGYAKYGGYEQMRIGNELVTKHFYVLPEGTVLGTDEPPEKFIKPKGGG